MRGGVLMRLKTGNLQKTPGGPIFNIHTKFQLLSPFLVEGVGGGAMRGTNSIHNKNQLNDYIFWTVRECNKAKKSRLSNDASKTLLTKSRY